MDAKSAWVVAVLFACCPRGEGCGENGSGGCGGPDSSADSSSLEDTALACEIDSEDIQVVAFCPTLTIDWSGVVTGPDGNPIDPARDIAAIRLLAWNPEVEDLIEDYCSDDLSQVDLTAWADLELEDGSTSVSLECDSEPWLLDFEGASSVIAVAYLDLEDSDSAVGWAVASPSDDADSAQLVLW